MAPTLTDDGQLEFYKPRPLSEPPAAGALELVMKAVERRLAFYVGAGASMSPPTDLPSGADVQRRIADRARRLLGVEINGSEGLEPTLEELGDAAEERGPEVLEQLRRQAADAIDFRNALPNLDGEMALRFDVYCREKGWLDPMGFLDRRETDVDDAWAHRSGARLVLCAARRRG